MKGETSVHSPAEGLTDGFAVGGGGGAGSATWHPDVKMTEKSGDSAVGTSDAPAFAGVSPTGGSVAFSQLVDGPQGYEPGEQDSMVGGLGTPPRP